MSMLDYRLTIGYTRYERGIDMTLEELAGVREFIDGIPAGEFRVGDLLDWRNPHYDMIERIAPALLSLDKRFVRVVNGWRRLTSQEILNNRLAHMRLKYHLLMTNPDLLAYPYRTTLAHMR